jgi:hypothetical protein
VGRITAWVLGPARESEAGIGVCGDQENGVGRLLSRILRMQRIKSRIKDGGNGVPGRSVALKEYDVLGHEVSGGRRVGPLCRVPMTLGSDRAKG